jgi:catechol 2,3-dioxygenase-like lactoylglutathione lyase family enzyme
LTLAPLLAPLARVALPCRDPRRQQAFYTRVLGLAALPGSPPRLSLGGVELVLRPRGDALFPQGGETGNAMLAFPVPDAELERWHRRMLTARVPVLEAPGHNASPPRLLRIADPEGYVVELFAAP